MLFFILFVTKVYTNKIHKKNKDYKTNLWEKKDFSILLGNLIKLNNEEQIIVVNSSWEHLNIKYHLLLEIFLLMCSYIHVNTLSAFEDLNNYSILIIKIGN